MSRLATTYVVVIDYISLMVLMFTGTALDGVYKVGDKVLWSCGSWLVIMVTSHCP
jgi:hypothetical protein